MSMVKIPEGEGPGAFQVGREDRVCTAEEEPWWKVIVSRNFIPWKDVIGGT